MNLCSIYVLGKVKVKYDVCQYYLSIKFQFAIDIKHFIVGNRIEMSQTGMRTQHRKGQRLMNITKDENNLSTLIRGLKVLEAFSDIAEPQSAADIARITDLPRATTGRILTTLFNAGYVSYENKRYELTPKILLLSQSYLASNNLPDLVRPTLEHITAQSDESSSLTVLSKTEVIYIARSSRKSLTITRDSVLIGSSLPAYCTSTGRVLLAALPKNEQMSILLESDLKAHTDYTVTDVTELLALLDQTQKDGFSIVDQEVELGICSIAVPVKNRRNEVVAALNISTHTLRTPSEDVKDSFLGHLKSASEYLQRLL